MKLNYINRIRAGVGIYASKRATNVLDGMYKSVFKGKSMNFENLREYVTGDDVQDIAWKASARSGTLLVKQFIAEKKHNVLLALDGGAKMEADSDWHENKKTVALLTAGTIGYVAISNDDLVGMAFSGPEKIEVRPFGQSVYGLEASLEKYDAVGTAREIDVNELLEHVYKYVEQKMIIFLITDVGGIDDLRSNLLRKICQRHDLLVVNVNDNFMAGKDVFDVASGEYVAEFFAEDRKMNEIERQIRSEVLERSRRKFKRNRISFTSISGTGEVNERVVELLKEHRYASVG